MGLSSSSPEPPRQNRNPEQQVIVNSLYNSRNPQFAPYSQFINRPPPTSNQTNAVPLKLSTVINKHSATMLPHESMHNTYYINFEYSSETNCQITIYFFVKENNGFTLNQTKPPQTFECQAGNNQRFQWQCCLDISNCSPESLFFYDRQTYPVVIEAKTNFQSLLTYYSFARDSNSLKLKPIRQKAVVGNQEHELQEIFGISNQNSEECIICLTEAKDTAIMPCRHACLCRYCAEMMKSQTDLKCPICRDPIISFLSINK